MSRLGVDAQFEHWLDDMRPEIAAFEEDLAPAGWEGGFTRDSLVALERYILDRWPDKESYLEERDQKFIDRAVRYIGESLLRACGGGWNIDHDPDFIFAGRPFVRLDTDDRTPISPSNLITAMLARRTGQVLSRVYDAQLGRVDVRRRAQAPGWSPQRDYVPGMMRVDRPDSSELAGWLGCLEARIAKVRERAARRGYGDIEFGEDAVSHVEAMVLDDLKSGRMSIAERGELLDEYTSFFGEVARHAAGGSWVVRPGPVTERNPYIGNPFVERTDEDGDPVSYLPFGSIYGLAKEMAPGVVARHISIYVEG